MLILQSKNEQEDFPMKTRILWILAICLLLGVLPVGCATEVAGEDVAARITVSLETSDDVYSVNLGFGNDGDVKSNSACCNADGSRMTGEVDFEVTELHLASLTDAEHAEVSVSITTESGDTAPEVLIGVLALPLTQGSEYALTISGSAADGYVLVVKE